MLASLLSLAMILNLFLPYKYASGKTLEGFFLLFFFFQVISHLSSQVQGHKLNFTNTWLQIGS